MSNITAVYDYLRSATVGGVGAAAPTPDLITVTPTRIVVPVFAAGTVGPGEARYFGASNAARVTWRVLDIMINSAVGDELGLAELDDLIAYAGAYADFTRTARQPAANCVLASVTITPGVVEWPPGSGSAWLAVVCELTIEEVIPCQP